MVAGYRLRPRHGPGHQARPPHRCGAFPGLPALGFGEAEWRPAFKRPQRGAAALLPVRVEDCDPGLLADRVYIDLVGPDEATARARLLEGCVAGAAMPAPAARPPGPASRRQPAGGGAAAVPDCAAAGLECAVPA